MAKESLLRWNPKKGDALVENYEYEVITYSSKTFSRLVFFCSEAGDCSFDEIPRNDSTILQELLNQRGAEGWELIQLAFGKDGVVSFWKRRK